MYCHCKNNIVNYNHSFWELDLKESSIIIEITPNFLYSNMFRTIYQEHHSRWHTTLFQRPTNIHNVHLTLYKR